MSLNGNLKTFDLSSLLRMLAFEKRTGKLLLRFGGNTIQIFLHEGDVVYATETRKNNRLGELLKESGYISQKNLEEGLAISLKNKERLGKTLVQQGYLSLEKLNQFLLQQAENIVCRVLLWDAGIFEYADAKLNLTGAIEYKLDTMHILLGASRRIDKIGVIKRLIPSEAGIPKISANTGSGGEIRLNASEWKILSLINGHATVRQVFDKSGFDDLAAYKLLYSLIASGKVEISLAMAPSPLAVAAVKKLGEVDPRQFREALDHLGLKRTSSIRVVLARIFREAISEEHILAAVNKEVQKINTPEEKNSLRILREESRVPFTREVIELLWQKVNMQ